jgi:hypothetical protein
MGDLEHRHAGGIQSRDHVAHLRDRELMADGARAVA